MRKRLLAAVCAAALLHTSLALAATTPNSFVTPQTPNRGIVQFLQGTDSPAAYKTLYTAGANGSICKGMWETNNDAGATHLITVELVNATIKYGGMAATTVLSEGYNGTAPAKNLMSAANWPGLPLDSDGNPFFTMASGDTIQATFATALTASDKINIVAVCFDY